MKYAIKSSSLNHHVIPGTGMVGGALCLTALFLLASCDKIVGAQPEAKADDTRGEHSESSSGMGY